MGEWLKSIRIYDRTNPDNVRRGTLKLTTPFDSEMNPNSEDVSGYYNGGAVTIRGERLPSTKQINTLGFNFYSWYISHNDSFVWNFNKDGTNRIEFTITQRNDHSFTTQAPWTNGMVGDWKVYYRGSLQRTYRDYIDELCPTGYIGIGAYFTNVLTIRKTNNGRYQFFTAWVVSQDWSYGEYYHRFTCDVGSVPFSSSSAFFPTDFFEVVETDDPYDGGGTSEDDPQGGGGDFDNTDTPIEIPEEPHTTAITSGFITLYIPTVGQIESLASYMWSNGFDLEQFKRIIANPIDAILGLSIIPTSGGLMLDGTKNVKVGNIETPISMNYTTHQYEDVTCGKLKVDEFWGGYLDYEPYTKCEIYLPYIGTQPIATDDIMNKEVGVDYRIDILNGSCVCFVTVNGSVLYQYSGNCATAIPVTNNNYSNMVNGLLQKVGGIASIVGGIATGNALLGVGGATAMAHGVMTSKPIIEKGSAITGSNGLLGVQHPYLIITRPRQCLPNNQNRYTGYPSYITKKLSELTGYNVIETERLANMSCTDGELMEIKTLLESGVIF